MEKIYRVKLNSKGMPNFSTAVEVADRPNGKWEEKETFSVADDGPIIERWQSAKACKEKHWDGCVYEPKDEKTCETCRHWKYIAHEWQCEACKCQGYEPKDEPQTCEDCKHNGEKHAYDYACDKCTDMDKFQHEDEPQTERNE